jgi:hypothetical protein
MARVFLDVCAASADWFDDIARELVEEEKVRFSYSPVGKLLEEHSNNTKIRDFYKAVRDMGRRDDADATAVQSRMDYLEGIKAWRSEKDCDDPHIFAIVFEKPTRFVISKDDDMANCRGCINKVVENRYCNFVIISRRASYDSHRHESLG